MAAALRGLTYRKAVLEYLRSIPAKHRRQIIEKVNALLDDPRPQGSKQLKSVRHGVEPVRRLRSGDYRILYLAADGPQITVLDINHRKDIYRKKG